MMFKRAIFLISLLILIGVAMCKEDNVKDRVCTFGGNAACRTYCFFTQGSVTGYCDGNNDCVCNSTSSASNNNDDITEVEIYVINK